MSEFAVEKRITKFLSRKEAEFPELHLEDRISHTTNH